MPAAPFDEIPMPRDNALPVMAWRLGFDIGGTFTDFALQDVATGAVVVGKHLTTPRNPAEGVLQGLDALLERARATMADVEQAVHGTTLGANLVIERKGARTFLVTTEGFRDVLEIQRQLRYNINDLFVDKHPPLIPRNQIVEIGERVTADGTVRRPLDPAQVKDALRACGDRRRCARRSAPARRPRHALRRRLPAISRV